MAHFDILTISNLSVRLASSVTSSEGGEKAKLKRRRRRNQLKGGVKIIGKKRSGVQANTLQTHFKHPATPFKHP